MYHDSQADKTKYNNHLTVRDRNGPLVFPGSPPIGVTVPYSFTLLMKNPDKKITKLIDMVLMEDQGDSLIELSRR